MNNICKQNQAVHVAAKELLGQRPNGKLFRTLQGRITTSKYPIPTFEEAQKIVDEYIAFYNYERTQLK